MSILRLASNFFSGIFTRFSSPIKVEEKKVLPHTEQLQKPINDSHFINLNRENHLLHLIIQNAEEGFLILDNNNTIKFINNFLLRKIGVPGNFSEYINRNSIELIRFPKLYESIKELPYSHNDEIILNLVSDTTQTEFEIIIKNIAIQGENLIFTKWRDITLSSKAEKIGKELVANVAHQLRTPLTSIKGYAETLLDGAFDDPSVSKKFLETILRNADRLTNLVRDILTLARLDDTKNKLDFKRTNINQIIKNVIEQLGPLAEDKGVKIIFSHPESDTIIMGCEQELEIAIHNLLDNAIKYTADKTQIDITLKESEDKLQLSIKDQGKGIPQKDCEKIFERFYRIEDGKSKKMIGTGLGLSIVKQIVELHHGRTWVESLWGHGATFFVEIPKAFDKRIPLTPNTYQTDEKMQFLN